MSKEFVLRGAEGKSFTHTESEFLFHNLRDCPMCGAPLITMVGGHRKVKDDITNLQKYVHEKDYEKYHKLMKDIGGREYKAFACRKHGIIIVTKP